MILDDLSNASLYHGLHPSLKEALDFLEQADLKGLAPGRHAICGERVFAGVDEYQTKKPEAGFWEAHRKHVDVQVVLLGQEWIGVGRVSDMQASPYDAEKDLLKLEGHGNRILMRPGLFAVFFPQDAHMPGLAVDQPEPVKKMVIKIRWDAQDGA